jgi:hypothetical protein
MLAAAGNVFFPAQPCKFFSGEIFIFLRRKIIFSTGKNFHSSGGRATLYRLIT